jgi:molybdenum cofactor biosynthesis enzyme MoaA
MLDKWNFPFIELQTNGILLQQLDESILKDWYNMGLTTISLSCASYNAIDNMEIFDDDNYLASNIKLLHRLGFSVRLSCVMVDGMIDNIEEIKKFVSWAKKREVEQLTVRPVGNISKEETKGNPEKEQVRKWIDAHSEFKTKVIYVEQWLDNPKNATTLLTLAHGAKVYDVNGQNISFNSCLTRSDNPDDIRQLIFSSDGHLRYDWIKEGAIII